MLNYEPRPNSSRFCIPVGRVGLHVRRQQPKLELCDSVAHRPRAMLSRVVCCTTVAKTLLCTPTMARRITRCDLLPVPLSVPSKSCENIPQTTCRPHNNFRSKGSLTRACAWFEIWLKFWQHVARTCVVENSLNVKITMAAKCPALSIG